MNELTPQDCIPDLDELAIYAKFAYRTQVEAGIETLIRFKFPNIEGLDVEIGEELSGVVRFTPGKYTKKDIEDYLKEAMEVLSNYTIQQKLSVGPSNQ